MSLALNYEPEVVVNIETLTREEWLEVMLPLLWESHPLQP